ncbi:Calpain-3, partial [Tetrabaena socialis]
MFGGKKSAYQDPDFRPNEVSLAQVQQGELDRPDTVRAADITQGGLGDCPLLSALACLATRAGAVEKLFLTPEYNEDGRYQVRLWEKQNRRYREITIDDQIPVWRQGGQPCFARPTGNEAWVLLLEKAVAKFVGSYHFLNGSNASWALEALTGHYTVVFLLDRK